MEASESGPVLIDTSAFVDAIRTPPGTLYRPVRGLVESRRARLAGPVVAEMLGGVHPGEEARLRTYLAAIERVPEPPDLWERTGDLMGAMRRRGRTLALVDAVVAALALAHDMPVLTLDSDFTGIPRLRLWNPVRRAD